MEPITPQGCSVGVPIPWGTGNQGDYKPLWLQHEHPGHHDIRVQEGNPCRLGSTREDPVSIWHTRVQGWEGPWEM